MDIEVRYLELVLKRNMATQRLQMLNAHRDKCQNKFYELMFNSNLDALDAYKFVDDTYNWKRTGQEIDELETAIAKYSSDLEELLRSPL